MVITLSFGLRLKRMTTCWKGNFIKFSIELYFGICSILYTGENPRQEQHNESKIEEITMTTRRRSLGNAFTKRTWSNSEEKNKTKTPRTSTNKDTSGVPSTNEDVASKPRWITRGDIKLHGHFRFSHEGPRLHINEKVCEKVKLYDFKWSALREATHSFYLYILIWPSTLHSLIGISSNIVPLL